MTHDGDKFELGEFIQVKINKQPMTQEKGTVVAEGGNRKLELTRGRFPSNTRKASGFKRKLLEQTS